MPDGELRAPKVENLRKQHTPFRSTPGKIHARQFKTKRISWRMLPFHGAQEMTTARPQDAPQSQDSCTRQHEDQGKAETELCPLISFQPVEHLGIDILGKSTEDISSTRSSLHFTSSDVETAVKSCVAEAVKSDDEPRWYGIPMGWIALGALTAVATTFPLQTAWTRRQNIAAGGPRYLNSSIILFAEIAKMLMSFILLSSEENGLAAAGSALYRQLADHKLDAVKISVPALLYTLQGNLLYYGVDKLSAPVYTVSNQLKILTTAFLTVALLGRSIGAVKWLALFLLTCGVSMVQVSGGGSSGPASLPPQISITARSESVQAGGQVKGLLAVLAACCTSGLAGVFLEKMLTQTNASIWMRNVQLGAVGAVMAFLTALGNDFQVLTENGFTQGFTIRECSLVLLHSIGGICTAAVLKYAGNILKCFSAALSVVLVTIISSFMTGFVPDALFVCGVALVLAAVFLYNADVPDFLGAWLQESTKAVKSLTIFAVDAQRAADHHVS